MGPGAWGLVARTRRSGTAEPIPFLNLFGPLRKISNLVQRSLLGSSDPAAWVELNGTISARGNTRHRLVRMRRGNARHRLKHNNSFTLRERRREDTANDHNS
jgi:hypothetical protein